METNVAFNTIGFYAALILNRLRAEREISEHKPANDNHRPEDGENRKDAGAKFKLGN